MGFKSTFTTEDLDITWPEWFCEKWKDLISFAAEGNSGSLHTKKEIKAYGDGVELLSDIQTCVKQTRIKKFVLVWLHECGGITRVQIEHDNIFYSEPETWSRTDEITHHYCYECSDVKGGDDGTKL